MESKYVPHLREEDKVKLEETLRATDCYIFEEKEDMLTPVFCKPKLIPLKTSSQKREQTLRETEKNRTILYQLERLTLSTTEKQEKKGKGEASGNTPSCSKIKETKNADVWTAKS